MPHFHGLRLTPRTGSAAATRSAARSPPPKTKTKKPVHFRGCSRGDDTDGTSASAEDFKRPRAVSPSSLAAARVPEDEEEMHHDSETVPFGSQHVESIYSLASPWMEGAVASREKKRDGPYGRRGGARALCFEQEQGDQVRAHGSQKQRRGSISLRKRAVRSSGLLFLSPSTAVACVQSSFISEFVIACARSLPFLSLARSLSLCVSLSQEELS